MVIIKKVETRKDMRDFINFPNILYKNNPLFVPSIYSDELADWNKKKNPAGICGIYYLNFTYVLCPSDSADS